MSYWLLTSAGSVISCSTVQRLTSAEIKTDEYNRACSKFDTDIEQLFDAKNTELGGKDAQPLWNRLSIGDLETDEAFIEEFRRVISNEDIPNADDTYSQGHDAHYINMELGLPRGPDDAEQRATDSEVAVLNFMYKFLGIKSVIKNMKTRSVCET